VVKKGRFIKSKFSYGSMINDYFERSQRIKKEIESESRLIKNITNIFESRDENLLLGEGSYNEVFQVGRTESGLYVALRLTNERHFEMHSIENLILSNERYCSVAGAISMAYESEKYWHRPIHFCVGVVYQDRIPGLLMEDVTKNKKYSLWNWGFLFDRMLNGIKVDSVHADLGDFESTDAIQEILSPMGIVIKMEDLENLKYFSKENRINL